MSNDVEMPLFEKILPPQCERACGGPAVTQYQDNNGNILRVHRNCKQSRVEAKKIMSNCEIDFSLFFEITNTILKIFSLCDLMPVKLAITITIRLL